MFALINRCLCLCYIIGGKLVTIVETRNAFHCCLSCLSISSFDFSTNSSILGSGLYCKLCFRSRLCCRSGLWLRQPSIRCSLDHSTCDVHISIKGQSDGQTRILPAPKQPSTLKCSITISFLPLSSSNHNILSKYEHKHTYQTKVQYLNEFMMMRM
jgi:hypothetical protein